MQVAHKLSRPSVDLRDLLELLPAPVLALDSRGHVLYANAAAENFLEMSAMRLREASGEEFLPPVVLCMIRDVLERGLSMSQYGVCFARKGEADVRAVSLGNQLCLMTLHPSSLVGDITPSPQGGVRSLSGMAAVLAHEIRNPLSGIRGAAQLLEAIVPEENRDLTSLVRDEVDRIRDLVARMEVFGDEAPLDCQAVNIHEVLDRVLVLVRNAFGISIQREYDPSLPSARGVKDELIQVFLNLVKNAAEAVREGGGEILLRTAYRSGVKVFVPSAGRSVGLPLEVSVIDTGGGIAQEVRPYLFEPFVTSKRKGMGLGLALTAKIIERHGGRVEVDVVGGKTIFRVLLPVFEES